MAETGKTIEENKAVALRYADEARNAHSLEAIDDLIPPWYVNHGAGTDESGHGARRIWEWLLSFSPDHRLEVEDAAQRDWASRGTTGVSLWGVQVFAGEGG